MTIHASDSALMFPPALPDLGLLISGSFGEGGHLAISWIRDDRVIKLPVSPVEFSATAVLAERLLAAHAREDLEDWSLEATVRRDRLLARIVEVHGGDADPARVAKAIYRLRGRLRNATARLAPYQPPDWGALLIETIPHRGYRLSLDPARVRLHLQE